MASLPETLLAARNVWARLSLVQRLVLALAVVAVVGAVAAAVKLAQGSMQTLYTGLSGEDSTRVAARLTTLGIPYRLGEGGASVAVPAERLDAARLALASEGLPSSGSLGFEIFDRSQVGATDFTDNVNLRRALEGELSRTVRSLDEVAAARVHVSLPRERPFARSPGEAKASVVLRLKPGRALAPRNVQAIQQLVASAVEGLRADSVVVLDERGSLLSRGPRGAAPAGLTVAELDEKKRFEEELAEKVVAILEPVFGVGRAYASVSADLESAASEETAELVDPGRTAVVSEQLSEERDPGGPAASGVAGVASNLDRGAGGSAEPQGVAATEPTRRNETRNYEVSRTVRKVSEPGGRLRRLSLAVVVNARGGAGGEASQAPDASRIESLVAAAAGIDTARGDQLRVEILPFDPPSALAGGLPVPGLPERLADAARSHGRLIAMLLLVALAYLLFLRPLKREAVHVLRAARRPLALPEPGRPGRPAAILASEAQGEDVVSVRAPAVVPVEVREAVGRAVSADPAATARHIRTWLEGSGR